MGPRRLVARTAWSVGHDHSAGGDDPLRYRESTQWRERGAVVPERGQSHLHGPAGLTADAGLSFRLLVTDPIGRFVSDTVMVTVEQGTSPPPTGDRIY